jgi:predicted TIM-barrel fold metal-dependent hydrolase
VNFIGHAQTWWANIDLKQEQPVLYPKWKVTAGGWTDRYLSDYPNMFGDLSAGSGLNALQRDQEHAHEFLKRHQDKLLYGSDCNDHVGTGPKCSGSQQIAMIRKLASPEIQKKIFWDNAARIIKVS